MPHIESNYSPSFIELIIDALIAQLCELLLATIPFIKSIQSNFCDILVLGKSRSVVAHSLLSKLTNANHVIKFPSMQNNHGQPHYMLLVPYPLQGFFPTLPYPKSKSTNRHSLVVTHINPICVE